MSKTHMGSSVDRGHRRRGLRFPLDFALRNAQVVHDLGRQHFPAPADSRCSPERCPWSHRRSRFSLSQVICRSRNEDTPVCMSATSAFEYSANLP